jgi:hypothetical protein
LEDEIMDKDRVVGSGKEIKGAPHFSAAIVKGGAPDQPESDNAMSWIVPPIIIPALFIVFIVARAAYVAYLL